jgi:hypothetical protein
MPSRRDNDKQKSYWDGDLTNETRVPACKDPSTVRLQRLSSSSWCNKLNAFGRRLTAVDPKVIPE